MGENIKIELKYGKGFNIENRENKFVQEVLGWFSSQQRATAELGRGMARLMQMIF